MAKGQVAKAKLIEHNIRLVVYIAKKFENTNTDLEDLISIGSIGLINSLANLFVDEKITLDQAKAQIEEKNLEILNRTIMQIKLQRQNKR